MTLSAVTAAGGSAGVNVALLLTTMICISFDQLLFNCAQSIVAAARQLP